MLYIEDGLVADMPLSHARVLWQQAGPVSQAVSSTAAGTFAASLQTPLFSEVWRASSMPATITQSFSEPVETSAIHIVGHDMGRLFREGSPVTVTVDINGVELFEFVPEDDTAIMILFEVRETDEVVIGLSGDTAPTIAHLLCGKALEVMRPIYGSHNPAQVNTQYALESDISRNGLPIGSRVRAEGAPANFAWQHLKASWQREYMEPWLNHMRRGGYATIAWRPSTFPDVSYVCKSGDIEVSPMSIRDLVQVSASLRALGPQR